MFLSLLLTEHQARIEIPDVAKRTQTRVCPCPGSCRGLSHLLLWTMRKPPWHCSRTIVVPVPAPWVAQGADEGTLMLTKMVRAGEMVPGCSQLCFRQSTAASHGKMQESSSQSWHILT